MKPKTHVALAVLIPALLALALVVAACGAQETTTTIQATTTTQALTTTTQAAATTTQTATTTPTASGPPADGWGEWVYEPASGRVILFGGITSEAEGYKALSDTWAYDPAANTWANLHPTGSVPSKREIHAMAYDPASGRLILFGGCSYPIAFNDTWAYDPATNTWAELHPGGDLPPARYLHWMIYDPTSKRMILFGGRADQSHSLGDTWAYDPAANTWANLHPTGSVPSPRDSYDMVYDPVGRQMILFGGLDQARGTLFNDSWAYDPAANTWTELHPTGDMPSPRAPSMRYDPASGRVILFGGGDISEKPILDTWAYDLAANTWTELHPGGSVLNSWCWTMYDPRTRRFILMGTAQQGWAYDPATNTYTELHPTVGAP